MAKKVKRQRGHAAPPEDLHQAVRLGTRAVLGGQIASQLVSLGVLAILFRLLAKEDYGTLGLALPAVMLPRMAATLGLSAATVQEQELRPGQMTTLFWLNLACGGAAALATIACGPLLAWCYHDPVQTPLCGVLGLTTLLVGAGNLHQSLLERSLRFAPLSRLRFAALAAGGLAAILVAWNNVGVWALVVQQAVECLLLTLGAWYLERWRPDWPARGEQVGSLAMFSGYYTLSNLVFYVSQNLDKLLFPLLLGEKSKAAVGLYSQAFNLTMRIVYVVTSALAGVMLPALSRARGDAKLYGDLAARFFRLLGIALFPCGVGLHLAAHEVMLVLGGTSWSDAGWILAMLAPAILVQGFINVAGSIFGSCGRAGRLLFGAVVICLLLIQGFVAANYCGRYIPAPTGSTLLADFGPTVAMAASFSAVSILVIFPPYLQFCLATAGVPLQLALRPLLPALRAAALMGLIVWGLRQGLLALETPALPRLLLMVGTGAVFYALLAWNELRWFGRELATIRGLD